MKLDRVEWKDGRPYAGCIQKSKGNVGLIKRNYGQIIICKNCGKKCFATDSHIKEGQGKFCSLKCATQLKNNPKWKNGRMKHGPYSMILKPNHPGSDVLGYIYEHRLVVETQIGRYLKHTEKVHHVNKKKSDNRPENLIAFIGHSSHRNFELGKTINSQDIVFDGRLLNAI